MQLVGLLVLVCALSQSAQAVHYRGGTFYWEKINNKKVEFFWRLSFKKSEGTYPCEFVGSQILAEDSNMLKCKTCSVYDQEIIKRLPLTCIATSSENDWNLFKGSYKYKVKSSEFTMSYETEGSCTDSSWLYLQNFDPGRCWNLLSHVDLSIDNNSPRVTAGLPLYRVRQGCELLIDLKASDPDGDIVRCRWADPNKHECPGDTNTLRVCGDPSKDPINATIYEKKCLVKFQTKGEYVYHPAGNYYGVSVMVEDFDDEGSTTPKSKVPYQFLIQLTEPGSCTGPQVTLEEECSIIRPGGKWKNTVSANLPEESDGNQVEEMTYILPKGMSHTEDIPPPGRFVQSTLSFQTNKLGIYEYTITATDDFGLQGESVAGKVLVTDDKSVRKPPIPNVLDAESYPATNSLLKETVKYWFIKFDKPVSRPEKPVYIRVLDLTDNQQLISYDAANSDEVEFLSDDPTKLRYKAPKDIKAGNRYVIDIDGGFSVTNYSAFCHGTAETTSDPSKIGFNVSNPPTVDCGQSEITASVPKSYANDKSVNELHLIDRRCKSIDNGTHLIIKFAYDSCGTYIKKKSSDITRFINILRDDPEPYQTSKLITRKKRKVNIKIICEVEGVGIANVYFSPDTSLESSKVESKTRLEAVLELSTKTDAMKTR
ncbi:uncharacterized protein [Antedon mediterranea]|uniref:uncharacterized protein n=1 Tax=Antedon mediterranea TaxID=105859 RepID=UPI003AF9420C